MAVGEMTGRRQRPGTGEQKLDAVVRRRGLWEQPQRPTEPARGAFGREPCCCLARIAEDGDGGDVALARRPLDVVGARRCCHSWAASASAHRRGHQVASRPRWPRTRRAERAGVGSGSVGARRSSE